MQSDNLLRAIFDMIDVSSVTGKLADYATGHAIFVGLAPTDAEMPYIVITEIAGSSFDTHDRKGDGILYQVAAHARTLYTALDIRSAIDAVLRYETPSISGATGLMVLLENMTSMYIKDEETHTAIADYRLLAQE